MNPHRTANAAIGLRTSFAAGNSWALTLGLETPYACWLMQPMGIYLGLQSSGQTLVLLRIRLQYWCVNLQKTGALEYRPDIDGLRAIAVVAVVLFHFQVWPFSGGFVGVDVFFVISGFLITRILRDEIDKTGRLNFRRFAARRLRRIYPALIATVIVTVFAAAFILSPLHMQRLGAEAASASLSLSNFLFWSESGYFDPGKQFKPLLHTWSLAVEEQFYLVWPLLLLLTLRLPLAFPLLLLGIAGASLAGAQLLGDRSAAFFLMPFRVYEFAIGASLVWASSLRPKHAIWLELSVLSGLAMIGYSAVSFSEHTHFPGVSALLPTVGAALVIFGGRAPMLGALLRNPVSVGLGLISYAIYLVHWPLLVLYQYATTNPYEDQQRLAAGAIVALLVVTLVLSILLYRFVEQRYRRGAEYSRTSGKRFTVSFASAIAICVALGSHIYWSKGWQWRLPSETAQLLASPARTLVPPSPCHTNSNRYIDVKGFQSCLQSHGSAVLIIGDSHSLDVANAIWANASRPHIARIGRGGCRAFVTAPSWCFFDEIMDLVSAHAGEIDGIIYVQQGSSFRTERRGPASVEDRIDAVIEYLESLAETGAPVIWLGPQWEPKFHARAVIAAGVMPDLDAFDFDRKAEPIEQIDSEIGEAIASRETTIDYISRLEILGPLTATTFIIDNEFTYSNGSHWSAKGEEVFGRLLLERIPELRDIVGLREQSIDDGFTPQPP